MLKFMAKLEAWVAICSLVTMFLCITLQVFFRYVLDNALEWPEEVARYAFISSVFFGAALAAGEGMHLEISFCKYSFGKKIQKLLTIASSLCTAGFCAIMVWWGIMMVVFVHDSGQMAESMSIPMWPFYLIVPLGMACMLLRIPARARRELENMEKQTGEQAISDQVKSW